uniref:JmjC domain-containing protein n=2 Tax=Ditylenchus dipsaci TaxID=166011 RepID=A0A915E3C9_9BILA
MGIRDSYGSEVSSIRELTVQNSRLRGARRISHATRWKMVYGFSALVFPRLSEGEDFNLVKVSEQFLVRKHFDKNSLMAAVQSLALAIENMQENTSHGQINEIEESLNKLHWLADTYLNVGHYAEVEDKHRLFYSLVCCLQARFFFKQENYVSALRSCDNGLLKGNDLDNRWLSKFASFLCLLRLPPVKNLATKEESSSKSNYLSKEPEPLPNSVRIPVMVLPSLCSFHQEFYAKNKPLIIRGMVNEWPAFRKWSFSYLNSLCGHRTVPVELGKKYTDEDWLQQLMSFHDYLAQYVFQSEKTLKTGYLAQHRLPVSEDLPHSDLRFHVKNQIPELLNDIIIPDYCAFGENGLNEDLLTINMFIGPEGTISPLHIDPRHNFFCQVRGRKFVRLINPGCRSSLYMFDDLMRQNTSQVDVENPDLKQFPRFSVVQCEDFLMEPGDCLFIPRGYFHHIRALEKSISVSIWFGD